MFTEAAQIKEISFETLDPAEPFNFEDIIELLEETISQKNTDMMETKSKVLFDNDSLLLQAGDKSCLTRT